ncbi:MAG: HAD hydrolase-like protein [Desulfosudaceae bacterium]
MALTTSKPTVYAEKILTHFNVADCFDTIVGSHMDGRRTDKAELIKTAFNLLPGHAYEKPVMVGDREHDITGAKKAGIESIGVLWGYGSPDELAGANHIAKDVKDLQALLTKDKETRA